MSRVVWLGAGGFFLVAALASYLWRPPTRPEPSPEQRISDAAEKEYRAKMKQLTDDLIARRINESAFARASTHEKAILEHRQSIAAHPEAQICNFGDDGDNQTHVWHIPAACDSGLQFTVWYEEQGKKTVRAKLYAEDGEAGALKFVALRGSSCKFLSDDRWEFDGNCQFPYTATGKRWTLKISVLD